MKKFYAIVLLAFISFAAFSQQFGNEWINYSQKYYAVKIVQKGVYRIDSLTLANSGIDLSVVKPQNLQVFGRQQEQSIYISGEADSVFNSTDYLEFFALGNDGWLDTIMYGGTQNMNDYYYSLYNDTATYYITYNTSFSNKRTSTAVDTNYSLYSAEPYCYVKSVTKYFNEYYVGPQTQGASQSKFVPGEGWTGFTVQGIPGGFTFVSNVNTPFLYTGPGAPNALLEAGAVSASNADLQPPYLGNHHLRIKYGAASTVIKDTVFKEYYMVKKKLFVSPSTLTNGVTPFYFEIVDDLDVASDIIAVANSVISYPRLTNMGSVNDLAFTVPFNSLQPQTKYSITSFPGITPIVYMFGDSVWRTNGSLSGGVLDFLVPNNVSGKTMNCEVYNYFTSITSLRPVNGTGTFTDYGNLMINDAYIILTHDALKNKAQDYANYRSSVAGGSHNTIVVPITELYDQFSAGIYKHSLAARRFCDYVINTWPSAPKYLFIIGKGVREASEGNTAGLAGARKDVNKYAESLVPSFGYPCSDTRITAGLNGALEMEPAIPTGRLAVSVADSMKIIDYLNKMIEYEQAQQLNLYTKEEKDWMKHVLEFGGGATDVEQLWFTGYLNNYKRILEDTLFAGTAELFLKTSSAPIDPVDFQEINDRLDNGVSMMVFFGHGSINGFDTNIDDVNNWQNQGKYPLLIANSCFSGDIHQPGSNSVSEKFTLIPDKGVIGFLATVKQGFVHELNLFSTELINEISAESYGSSIGSQIKKSIAALNAGVFPTTPIGDIAPEEVFTGMTLHGDPALKINYHNYPELVIESSDVVIEPENVTLADDSMNVVVHITNLGKGTNTPFIIKLTRSFPNGNGDSTYLLVADSINYKYDAVFRIPVYHSIAFGANQFEVTIDLENPAITEQYDEVNNNRVNFTYTISGNSIFPVYPYEYAIVPDSIIEVKASTVNPLASTYAYRFEIDTTDEFNSPFKRYLIVNSTGGVVTVAHNEWLLQSTGVVTPLIHTDSTVYFWRVSPDSTVFIWQESSYQYINNQSGWGQAHFFQFKNNKHTHLDYDRPLRKWEFETLNEIVNVDVFAFPGTASESYANAWFINGAQQEYDCQGGLPTLFVGVIDPYEEDPWKTFDGTIFDPGGPTNIRYYGQFNCYPITGEGRTRGEKYFGFRQDNPAQLDSLIDMVENDIPCGHYYVIYTYSHASFSDWNTYAPELYSFFQNLGVTGLDTGMANRPLIVMGRKCDTASTKFILGPPSVPGLTTLSDTIAGVLPGIMSSVKIGPAYEWNTLYWKQHPLESPITGDSTVLSVYGINTVGIETKLFDTAFTVYDSILNLNGLVNASIYPYIKLRATTEDRITLTPTYFERWQILYQPVPEAALEPKDGYYFSLGTSSIEEGDKFKFAMAIKNISQMDMDSLLVHYWVEDQNHVKHYLTYSRQDSLKINEILLDTIVINTNTYPGQNYLWIEANPVPLASTTGAYDQLEQHHFNNIARIPFTVNEDNANPILDVTFDGRHILNGDIVSAKPFILVSLDDENPYLLMNELSDTTRFLVYLTKPSGVEQRIYFNQSGVEQLKFIPAGSDNKCKIEWNAQFTEDGIYGLRVKAWDKNDNQSSSQQGGLKIQFEVIQRQTITHVMNYPNPFSTKTHFVFTLTGSEAPEYMKIQIFNVSGKVVREITTDELGPVYVGKNVTEYAWDGKDEFGDQLANGVYFYRVISKNSTLEDIENRESGADQFFKKGFGKMYLMR